jgi:Protein of unknown function (DUF3105)
MAQRKTTPPASKKPATGKPGAAKATATKPGTKPGVKTTSVTKKPPVKKPGKSIVNQKQTPWGLISVTAVIVVFAVGIVVFAISQHKSSSSSSNPYTQPELAAAKAIPGVVYKKEPDHTHVTTAVKYDTTPPTGGNHSQIWADCSGTVYANPIANENAVHMLEHGAVWITYNAKTLPAAQLAVLKKLVDGVDRMALSPYPDLKTPVSLQAWGYQLFVPSANDPRVQEFINNLRFNPKTTPEQAQGVTCSDPQFKTTPSTFGHPIFNL